MTSHIARRVVSVRLPAALVEAIDETAEEILVSRSRLIEAACTDYLRRLELPTK